MAEEEQREQPRLSGPTAALSAWLVAAVVNAALIALTVPRPPLLRTRVLHHLYDLGQFAALGLLAAAIVDAWARWGSRGRRWELVALAALSGAVGALTLPPDLQGFSTRMAHRAPPLLTLATGVALLSLGVPAARLVGGWLARPLLRGVTVGLAVAGLVINATVLQLDYPGIHLFVALCAVTFMASGMAGTPLPGALVRLRGGVRRRRVIARIALGLVCVAASVTVVVWPPVVVAAELLRCSSSVLPPLLGRLQTRDVDSGARVPREAAEWYRDRSFLPPVAASTPRLLPSDAVVLLFSIDAVRADVIRSPKYAAQLPTLNRIADSSVDFVDARAPGSQTVYTIGTMFSGTYFSEQYWTAAPFDKNGLWPHEDGSPRFPELLSQAGVRTVTFSGSHWLLNRWGCVRGFQEETRIEPSKSYYTHAEPMMDAVLARLQRSPSGPLFLFVHFLDPHAPYDLSPVKGSEMDRWVGEIGMVDAQLARLLTWLDASPLASRTALIVTADHGEAFGEHKSKTHATTLYDEVLRVPLMIRAPGVAPRVVKEPVSLVDVAPTVLDLMGQATPGHYKGQSLVPFLRGRTPELTRPILAEGRLKQSLVLPDGRKIIVDNRTGSVELYDLAEDPGELRNLAGDPAKLEQPLALLRHFFSVHTLRRPGYVVPYRK